MNKYMGLVSKFGKTVLYMKDTGQTTKLMAMGDLFTPMVIVTKEIGKMVNNMVEGLLPGLMVGSIQVYSRTANHMGREHTQI